MDHISICTLVRMNAKRVKAGEKNSVLHLPGGISRSGWEAVCPFQNVRFAFTGLVTVVLRILHVVVRTGIRRFSFSLVLITRPRLGGNKIVHNIFSCCVARLVPKLCSTISGSCLFSLVPVTCHIHV